jgi:hypothetical protein
MICLGRFWTSLHITKTLCLKLQTSCWWWSFHFRLLLTVTPSSFSCVDSVTLSPPTLIVVAGHFLWCFPLIRRNLVFLGLATSLLSAMYIRTLSAAVSSPSLREIMSRDDIVRVVSSAYPVTVASGTHSWISLMYRRNSRATLKPGYAPSTLQIKRSCSYQISGRVYGVCVGCCNS